MDEKCDAALPIMSHPEDTYDDAFCTGVRADVQHWHNDRDIRTVLFAIVDWLSTALGELTRRGRAEGAMGPGPQASELAAPNTTTETLSWLRTKTPAPDVQFERGDGRGAR
jgi:hypothetical protein